MPPTQTSPRGRSKSSAPANGRCQGRSSTGIQDGDTRLDRTRRHSTWLTPSRVRKYLQSRGEMRAEPMDRLLASSSGHFSGRSRPDKAHELTAASTGTPPLRRPSARLTRAGDVGAFILWWMFHVKQEGSEYARNRQAPGIVPGPLPGHGAHGKWYPLARCMNILNDEPTPQHDASSASPTRWWSVAARHVCAFRNSATRGRPRRCDRLLLPQIRCEGPLPPPCRG
jgi:hypothetical protein